MFDLDNNNNYTPAHWHWTGWSSEYIVFSARDFNGYIFANSNYSNKWMLQMDAGGECKCTHGVVCSGPTAGASRCTVVLCRSIDQWRRLATYPNHTIPNLNQYLYLILYSLPTPPSCCYHHHSPTSEQQWLVATMSEDVIDPNRSKRSVATLSHTHTHIHSQTKKSFAIPK